MISSIVYLTCKKGKLVNILKYISTLGLFITFIVVIFILGPMINFNYVYLFFYGTMFLQHLVCPILAIITFIFFDDLKKYSKKDSVYALSFTVFYGVLFVILNLLRVVDGPYPFLKVYDQGVLLSIMWFIIIMSLSYFLSYLLRKMYLKYNK